MAHDALGPSPDRDEVKMSMAGSRPRDRAAAPRGAEPGQDEKRLIESMRILKRSIDFAMILALAGLGIMVTVLVLQGFRVHGFYLDPIVLTALVPSLSAAAALRVLGGTGSGAVAPGDGRA